MMVLMTDVLALNLGYRRLVLAPAPWGVSLWQEVLRAQGTCQSGAHAPCAPGPGDLGMPAQMTPKFTSKVCAHLHWQFPWGLGSMVDVGIPKPEVGPRGGCSQRSVVELWHQPGLSTACPPYCSWPEPRNRRKGEWGCRLGARSLPMLLFPMWDSE